MIVIILPNGQYPTRLHSVAKWNDASKKVACCKLLCLKRRGGSSQFLEVPQRNMEQFLPTYRWCAPHIFQVSIFPMAGGYKLGSDFQMERRKWQEKWQAQCAELEAIPPKGRGGGEVWKPSTKS